jgi:hypothetical protein
MPFNRLGKNYQDNPRIMPLGTYIGFVKRNDDAQRMGRLSVFIPELGGDPEDTGAWVIVSYASPFAGATDPTKVSPSSQTMDGSQQSYGLWMIPPDLNNEVAVFFANGDISRGYWFACCYQTNMNHMVPGIATNVTTLPVTPISTAPVVEYNKANVDSVTNPRRPRFDPLADGLLLEGLAGDNERGVASTSARREAPSQVFGFLTPRGNTVHIDDNTTNEFIRLRTRSGAQVLIHETTGYVYINSKNGNSWIEISDAGVDVYTADSISMRAELDFNIRADRDINFDAGSNIHLRAGTNITLNAGSNIEAGAGKAILTASGTNTEIGAGANLILSGTTGGSLLVSGGDYQVNASGNVRSQSGSDMTQNAGGNQIRNGAKILDNAGPAIPSTAAAASGQTNAGPSPLVINDSKQVFANNTSDQTTWRPAGRQVTTIVSRMPTHEPWRDHPNGQVPPPPTEDVEINAAPTYDAGSSSQVLPDGTINDSGCSPGVSGTKPISSEVYAAITNACTKTGADHATMLAFADMESSFQPGAAAGTSSASGLYQFTSGTWQAMVTKYGNQYNVAYNQINDPTSNALMGGQFIQDNAAILKKNGISNPTPGQLYIMHFMGTGGGPKLIAAAQTTPDTDAAQLFPAAASANPSIFRGKTCAQVVAALSAKADAKAQAYSGQYGLPAPCDRASGGSPAIPLAKQPEVQEALVTKGTNVTPTLMGNGSTMLASLHPNSDGFVGRTHQCVSLVQATGLPNTAQWVKGSTDPTTWAVGQPIAVFDNNGRYANHTNGSSHAAIFVGIAQNPPTQHARYQGKPDIVVVDQWVGQPAHVRTIYADPARGIVDNALNYAAINILT